MQASNIMKTKTKPITWHSVTIPGCFILDGKTTKRMLRLRLANDQDRKEWEFSFVAISTPKLVHVYLFIVDWDDPTTNLPLPKTAAMARERIGKRESFAFNSGFDFHFRHESGFPLLQSLLNELAEKLEATRMQAVKP